MILPEEIEMIINEYSKPHYRYHSPLIPELKEYLADREWRLEYSHNGNGYSYYDYFMDQIKEADNRKWIPDERTELMRCIGGGWGGFDTYFELRDYDW